MTSEHGMSGSGSGLRGMRRKAVGPTQLVKTGFVAGNEDKMPLLITPAVDNVDLPAWCASNREAVAGLPRPVRSDPVPGLLAGDREGVRDGGGIDRQRSVCRLR